MAVSLDFSAQNLSLLRRDDSAAREAGISAETARARVNSPRAAHLKTPLERKRSEATQAAQDFESMFLEMMLKSMRQTATPEDASNAMDIYTGLLDSEYAKSMSGNGGVGIQQNIMEWMKATDPDLNGPVGGSTEAARNANAATEKTLRNFRIQQYQNQMMMPLMAGKPDGME